MNKRRQLGKRIVSLTLATVLLLFTVVPANAATTGALNSDAAAINSDGNINSDGAINSDGNARMRTFSVRGRSMIASSKAKNMSKGWHSIGGYRYYFYKTGKYYKDEIKSISGKKYCFDKSGHLLYGVNKYDGSHYYSDSKGVIRESAGFVTSDGYRYYVTKGGKIMTGRTFKVSGKTYKAYGNGKLGTGVFKYGTVAHFYADKNGVVRTKAGFISWNGYRYYITKNAGRLECGRTFKVKGKTYKAYSTGKLGTGVFKYGTTARFYADKYGVVKTTAGFVECLGNRYYVQKGGKIELGHTFTVKGRKYKAFADGRLGTGIFKYGSKYYYADSDGAIASKAGVVSFKKKYYYVNKNGSVAMNGLITAGSKKYMANADGTLKTGFFEDSGTKYYAGKKGEIVTKEGFLVVDGGTYYIQKGGAIFWGHTFTKNGKTYKAYASGKLGTGLFKYGSSYYYADGTGAVKTTAGLITVSGKKYYVKKGGKIAVSTTITTGGTTYKADSKGVLTAQKSTTGTELMKIAQKEVGTKTGKKYWEAYFGTKFRNGDSTPWCGTFVTWCFKKAGLYSLIKDIEDYGNLGYVPSYSAYANKKKIWVSANKAKAGDIIIFGSSSHVGLVKSVSGNVITTIEGNTGSTRNGEVKQKTYSLTNSWIKGVMRVIR
ncbi:MAG: CHAP domain-containing protein [Clostridia bacterium]|nr:CHAP domain-containing protein [uncultured Mogibacterium sp.]MDY5450584.1 CHAP domain-containing protein [Clostridia bacterium]MEE0369141.1 CHAP domain-containing protein [Clostridia bacterium]